MHNNIFDDISETGDYGAGSSHAITGYKVRDNLFVTIRHEDYVPEQIDVYFKKEDEMTPADGENKFCVELDWVAGSVHSEIPGLDTFHDCMRLVYIARCGEVVRDDC